MPYTLVVVDMQDEFDAALNPSVVIGVTKEILRAIKTNSPVLFLEYKNCGPTHRGLLDLVKGYPRKARITKAGDDGSLEAIKAVQRKEWPFRHMRVCGVNTDCCVWSTVEGILKRTENTQVEVVKEACGTCIRFDWRQYIRHPQLRLV